MQQRCLLLDFIDHSPPVSGSGDRSSKRSRGGIKRQAGETFSADDLVELEQAQIQPACRPTQTGKSCRCYSCSRTGTGRTAYPRSGPWYRVVVRYRIPRDPLRPATAIRRRRRANPRFRAVRDASQLPATRTCAGCCWTGHDTTHEAIRHPPSAIRRGPPAGAEGRRRTDRMYF